MMYFQTPIRNGIKCNVFVFIVSTLVSFLMRSGTPSYHKFGHFYLVKTHYDVGVALFPNDIQCLQKCTV